MIIDLTTHNTVYNPTGAQGQWFQHRWGRRDYGDYQLTLEQVKFAASKTADPVIFLCTYGDPADWPYLAEAAEHLQNRLQVITYGMLSESDARSLRHNGCLVKVMLDGFNQAGTVFLNARSDVIQRNLQILSDCAIAELNTYTHNVCEIPELVAFCNQHSIKLMFTPGVNNDNFGTCIVSESVKWLYDVYPVQLRTDVCSADELSDLAEKYQYSKPVKLNKSIQGYERLRTYYRVVNKRNIFQRPMVAKLITDITLHQQINQNCDQTNLISVSPTGHVFSNDHMFSIFMRILCTDWDLSRTVVAKNSNNYVLETLYCVQKLLDLNLEELLLERYFK